MPPLNCALGPSWTLKLTSTRSGDPVTGVVSESTDFAKYNYMLDEQRRADKRDATPLLPGEKQPTLPPLTEIPGPEGAAKMPQKSN